MSVPAGYGSWGGVPDTCRVRAKRRSPWASSRVPLTAPQAAAIGASSPGSTSLVNSSNTPRVTSNVASTMPPRVQRRPNRSSAANPPGNPQQAGQDRRDAQQPDEHARVDEPGEPVAKQQQHGTHDRGDGRRESQPEPGTWADCQGETERHEATGDPEQGEEGD